MDGSLEFRPGYLCAGSGCGGHLGLSKMRMIPVGWQGAAQHTSTRGCDGLHAPGPCPSDRGVMQLVTVAT